jgi:hypothetical protein
MMVVMTMWLPRQACSQAGTRPSRAKRGGRDDADRDQDRRRQVAVEGQHGEPAAQAADIGLALAADIEQAAMEGDGHGKPGEDEVGRVVERVADRLRRADRARHQQAQGVQWIDADQAHDDGRR